MAGKEIKVYKKIVWTLNGMTKEKIEGYGVGYRIDSPTTEIVVGDDIMEWSLQFYPCGINEAFKDSIGLFLDLNNKDSTEFNNVKFILGIIGEESKTGINDKTGEEFKVGAGWGSKAFMKRDELCDPNNEYLTGDKLTISCELTITTTSKIDETSPLNQGLLSHFKKMLESEVFADLRIKTNDGHDLKAHKNVLVVRSSAFEKLLTGNAAVVRKKVLEVDEAGSIMKQVLRFIYCNEVEDLKETASKLIVAAEKIELKELKKLCINSMIASLTVENVLQTLLIADGVTKSNKLKEKCFDMISSNFQQVSSNAVKLENVPNNVYVEIFSHNANKCKNTIHIQGDY